jgi:uncharacterized membrane protein
VYKWKRGGFKQLPTLSNDTATHVLGINDAGVVVGSVFSPEASVERAFIRGTDGAYTLFFHPDAENTTEARGISDSGLVTGFRDVPGGGSAGFIYNPATDVWVDVAPSQFTIAQGINGSGEVVGSAHFNDNEACPGAAHGRYGWLRAPDGSITYFQVNGKYTEARGINDAGFIAGSVIDHETEIRRGFVVQLSASSRCESITIPASELLEFPGFDATIPEAITDKGVVVGIVFNNSDMNSSGLAYHSFVATPR